MLKVDDVRRLIIEKYKNQDFVIDKTGVKTVELIGASFIADEPSFFGTINHDWNQRELEWYKSQSLYVKDIPGKIPVIWEQISSKTNDVGKINSNYGYLIWSKENGSQYENVLKELKSNPDSRRGQMVYTRPSIHTDYNKDGMSDFICCSNTVHFIRNNQLVSTVYFRSNDIRFGYSGDWAFANYVHQSLAKDLGIEAGNIIWNAASFHLYERHFNLLDEWIAKGY